MTDTDKVLESRKAQLFSYFTRKKQLLFTILLGALVWFGFFIRTRNIPLLRDVTTGTYIMADPDATLFLRYVQYVFEHGEFLTFDPLRYYPFGYYPRFGEFGILSHFSVWLYNILHSFNPQVTIEYAHALYPAVAFALSLVFFFILVKKLFDSRVALLSTAFLIATNPYLFRTMAGVSDKESLGMLFFFISISFYLLSFDATHLPLKLLFSGISGAAAAFMMLSWGGANALFLLIGLFTLIEILLNKFTPHDYFSFFLWCIVAAIILYLFYPERYTFTNLISSLTTLFVVIAFFTSIITLILTKIKTNPLLTTITRYLPLPFVSLIVTSIFGFIFLIFTNRTSFITSFIQVVTQDIINPLARGRWGITVAESRETFIADWIPQFGTLFFILFIIGFIFFLFSHLHTFKKHRYYIATAYSAFFILFLFSKYRSDSILNGTSIISAIFFIGSLALFFLVPLITYLYTYAKHKPYAHEFSALPRNFFFIILWLFICIFLARGAIRLLMFFAPIAAILVSYALFFAYDKIITLKQNILRYSLVIILLILVFTPGISGNLTTSTQQTLSQAQFLGPGYNQQWQYAMKWVRENTPEDAAFAHWWDYGYWIQTGGRRATLTDGGNDGGPELNYWMGRHVLTGQSEREALEYLYSHNATHFLVVSDEIGKYSAFSSIGSNLSYDRYSYIPVFNLDLSRSQENRDQTLYFYAGGAALDEDIIYQDTLFPAGQAGIGAIVVPISSGQDNVSIGMPTALLVYAGKQYSIPLPCVYFNNKEILFAQEEGLQGCFRIIPRIDGDQGVVYGAGLYLSRRVRSTLFTQLYLYNKPSDHFIQAYTDAANIPLALYNGRLIGPLMIWEIRYPDNLQIPEEYYKRQFPDPVLEKLI